MLAAGLRFAGVAQGWPRNYVPDTTVVRAAMSLGAGTNPFLGDPLPTQYPYFLPYLLALVYGVFFVAGEAVGWFRDLGDFETFAFGHPEVFFLIARSVVAAFGCAQVWLVASIARRALDDSAAWMAAMFCATSLLLVQLSQQARPHIVATTLILWSAELALRYGKNPRRGTLCLSWLASGLAAATVPNALPSVAIPISAGFLANGRRTALAGMIVGGSIFLAVLALCYPGLVVSPGRSFGYDSSSGVVRFFGGLHLAPKFLNGKGLPQLLTWLVLYEPVPLAFALLGTLGALLPLTRRFASASPQGERPRGGSASLHGTWFLLGVFPLLYLAIFASYEVIHPRYLVPVVPFLSIPAAAGATRLGRWISARTSPAWGTVFAFALFVLPLVQALRLDFILLHQDTRSIAEAWIGKHLGGSRLIALEPHGVELLPERASLEHMSERSPGGLGIRDRRRLRLQANDGFPIVRLWEVDGYRQRSLEALEEHGVIDHVVVVRDGGGERTDRFYQSLTRTGRLLARIDPFRSTAVGTETLLPLELRNPLVGLWRIDRSGPVVEIFELRHG